MNVITTSDGSHSLLNTNLDEPFHSRHGAIQESNHVFIRNGFSYFLQQRNPAEVHVLEVGFGTGLNALLTLEAAGNAGVQTGFMSLEIDPLPLEIVSQLNYPDLLPFPGSRQLFKAIHTSQWNKPVTLAPYFCLHKRTVGAQRADLPRGRFDIIYFDAFAPAKQPELWTLDVLSKMKGAMSMNGVFVTYCAKGQFKRDLRSLGLKVETLPGPPGKNEMVRATNLNAD